MNFREYQTAAMSFLDSEIKHDFDARMTLGALGISGEAGEVTDLWKKVCFHCHPFNKKHFIKELGDVMWYITLIADSMEVSLEEVMETNIDKLAARYPNGFNIEKSLNRAEIDI